MISQLKPKHPKCFHDDCHYPAYIMNTSVRYHFLCGWHREQMIMRHDLQHMNDPYTFCYDLGPNWKEENEIRNMIYGNFSFSPKQIQEYFYRIKQ